MDYRIRLALKTAALNELEALRHNIEEGPYPWSERAFGDTSYDESIWKPAVRYWMGQAKALEEYITQEHGYPVLPVDTRMFEDMIQLYGEPYVPCANCGRWFAPECMIRTVHISSTREEIASGIEYPANGYICIKCDDIETEGREEQ
jgi:hypothetical protein